MSAAKTRPERAKPKLEKPGAHKWEFRPRFRRKAFGWKSQPAITRVKQAVSEIKQVARTDQILAAEGAVLFLEKVSAALENVDSSSGSMGTAVNNAVDALVKVIAAAPADLAARQKWLERLWVALEDDHIPYIETLGYHWGELCASKAVASRQADALLGPSKLAWSPADAGHGYFRGSAACLSALLAAERYQEILNLLESLPYDMWLYRQFGVKALAALGRGAEAIRYAEEHRGRSDSPVSIAQACEEILLASGLADEAYQRYGLLANQASTYAAWFRSVKKKYPKKQPHELLGDLVAQTPGEEGKWFAAAKDAKLFDEAIALANRTPGSPQTLTRAARDFEHKRPEFAIEAGMAALRCLVEGYGYDITSADVSAAYKHTMQAAEHAGRAPETLKRIRDLVASETMSDRFVSKVLGPALGLR